jgi:predicted RNA binding protein YcfA (HicA-like mRNA interferase family)
MSSSTPWQSQSEVARLPLVSGKEVAKRLQKAGFEFVRQTGSRMILRRERPHRMMVSIPDHKELKKGTLKHILQQAGVPVEEFEQLA